MSDQEKNMTRKKNDIFKDSGNISKLENGCISSQLYRLWCA